MRKLCWGAFLTVVAWVPAAYSQSLPDERSFIESTLGGFRVYGISANYGYSVLNYPQTSVNQVLFNNHRTRMNYGISGTAGWQRFRGRTAIGFRYSGTYNGNVYDSYLNRIGQFASLTLGRQFGEKWSVHVAAQAQDTSLHQYIFTPNALATQAQTSTNFSNLAALNSIGQFSSLQSGVQLAVAPLQNPAITALLLGGHVLTYSSQAEVTYRPYSRLSFSFGGFSFGGRRRVGGDPYPGLPVNNFLPDTMGVRGTAALGMTYDLSPRSTIGIGVTEGYIRSNLQNSLVSSAQVSFGRRMGLHWFLSGFGGASYGFVFRQTYGLPREGMANWGGSIGYELGPHTWLASYRRSGFDLTGATVGANTIMSAAWNLRPRGKNWNVNAGFYRSENDNSGFSKIYGWQESVSYSQRVASQFVVSVNYSYLKSQGDYLGVITRVNIQAIRLSIGWAPRFNRAANAAWNETEQQ